MTDKELIVHFGPSQDPEHVNIVDSVIVYGRQKDDFGWADDVEESSLFALFANSAASASGDLSKTTISEVDKLFNIYECFVTSSLQVLDWSFYFSRVSERFF